MATILTKKKDTTGAPAAGDLTNSAGGAELAVNTADKRLYTKDSGGNVVEVGTNPGTAVTFTAGTVSAPAITTTGDVNTGIFFPAADTIAFAEGGAEAMRIDSSGNVGIGVTPSAWRSSDKAIQVNTHAVISSNTAGDTQLMNNAYFNSSNVGVYINTNFASRYEQYQGSHAWYTAPSGTAGNAITFTQAMTLNASGNLGIGETSPSGRLDIKDTNVGVVFKASNSNGYNIIDMYRNTSTIIAAIASGLNSTGNSNGDEFLFSNYINGGNFVFRTNSGSGTTERARITSDGNLLVGTTTASGRLTAKGTDSTADNWGIYIVNSSNTDLLRVRNDGYFITGSATNSPYNYTTGSAANVFIDANGGLLRSTSSLKYKTNVQDSEHGLDKVMQLRSVIYNSKNDGDKIFGGLIAEEVDSVGLTEFVQYAEDGTPDAIHYGNMVALAFKAIQELKAELDTVKAELNTLKGA